MSFAPGQIIVRRDIHRDGVIGAVETARVVRDDPNGLLNWTRHGSQCMNRATLTGDPIRKLSLAECDRTPSMLWPRTWEGTSVLIWTRPGVDHSIWWFFGLDGGFRGWYVNLESPGRRWPGGLDIQDHALDMVVQPDLTWAWKDEDELAERIGHPAYWTDGEAVRIRQAGEGLIPLIEAGRFPFDGWLTDFRPDSAWGPTRLPAGWDAGRPS
jgi:hypothetical protein